MEKTRLEAFSDAVLAIIITIMVLELKPPHHGDWHALVELLPIFASYAISFLNLGIYWANHHHLLHTVKRVHGGIIWANTHMLFWLSLVPFATAWMSDNHYAPDTVAAYAVLLLICGISYSILQQVIKIDLCNDPTFQAAMRHQTRKGMISVCCYLSAIPIAYFSTLLSCLIFLLVGLIWLIPDRNIEQTLHSKP